MKMTEFIDLNRRFYETPDQKNPEELAQASYLLRGLSNDNTLGWPELLQRWIVVILGEAGSGKSTELQFQADKLRGHSEQSFFVRLDRLVSESLVEALGDRDRVAFQDWQRGSHTCWFFFDSVDESKIRRPDDFLITLDKICDAIGIRELRRARLIFTSRISEWRPVTDGAALRRRFCLFNRTDTTKKEPREATYSLLEQRNEGDVAERQKGDKATKDSPLVVYLAPLDPERVRRYAQWRGLPDPEAFIHALETNYAWEFARRPLDVNGLIEYWKQHGRLGSLTELIEHSLRLSLRETEPRETNYPLTPETARRGAEALAAAVLLCRNFNIKVPDDAYIPPVSALDASHCLPAMWSAAERRALLTRPLFDGATYGCIRFHHRRMIEYLAASWINERMRDGCPLARLGALLFAQHQGEYILRPTLASVATWLANGNEPHNRQVRERLLQIEPGIHFRYGDPAQLPLEYKRRILNALCNRYSDRRWVWLEHDPEALARLADPSLSADVSAVIRNRHVPKNVREDMFLLVRYGRLTACLEIALEVIAAPDEEETIKLYAAAALRDCADTHIFTRLADVARSLPTVSNPLSGILCEALYPNIIGANGLCDLLRKTEAPERFASVLPWTLRQHLKEKLAPSISSPLLAVFVELLRTEPHIEHGHGEERISQHFGWLGDVLPIVLGKVLEQAQISSEDVELAAQSIRMLETHWDYGGTKEKDEGQQLSNAVRRHLALKRNYFWQGTARFRATNGRDPEWLSQILGWQHFVYLDSTDIAWLTIDARQRRSATDRVLALRSAFELWHPYGKEWRYWFGLLRGQFVLPELHRHFWKSTFLRMADPARSVWVRQVRNKLLTKYWWKRRLRKINEGRSWVRDQYLLHRYLYRLYSGKATGWLMNLAREAEHKRSSSRWAVNDWLGLREKRGPLVAWATRRGCEVSWVRHTPLLPHEKPNPNQTSGQTIVGLCGLQSLWQRGRLDFAALPEEDAVRTARYALCELNGFADWLPELIRARPQAVRQVFKKAIIGEWQFPPDREHFSEVLSKLVWQGECYWPLIADDLLAQLQIQDPLHQRILNYAVSVLLKTPNSPHGELAVLAAQRVANYPPESPFFTTWTVLWLQLDAVSSIAYLLRCMNVLTAAQRDNLMLRLCDALHEDRLNPTPHLEKPNYLQPQAMRILLPLVYQRIRPTEDIDHTGGEAYTPTEQDHAQEFRNGLLRRFAEIDHPEVLITLKELRDTPQLSRHSDWITHLIERHVMQKVDLLPWQENEIRTFAVEFETNPRNDTDLFRIACWRIQDIKKEVEIAENSLRDEVQQDWDETDLRRWFQRKLNERSRNRYTIPQEAEIDGQQRADLRFENPSIRSAVPVEIKWADNWTARELLERLENQLVGQYMRAYNIRYGIYLLGYIGRKQQWDHPTEERRIGLSELIRLIEERAREIEQCRHAVSEIFVIALDFTAPR